MSFYKELKRRNVVRVGIAYTVATWLLIQVTDTVFPRIGLPDSAVTLVIALLAIGFIPALIFAWAFEMTADGIKREKHVDRTKSITPKTGRKLDRMIILVLGVVVVWFLIDEYYFESQPTSTSTAVVSADRVSADTTQSIAVLPFINMSADADNEYFSDGISEELLNALVKISTLHVASRTSAFAYKGKNLPISQIARELKVNNILEGSVRKAGNRVRITAQLIDAKSDRHLWSETYERELVDIFDIQEEISNNIVTALKVVLNVDETVALGRAQHPTENTEAFELYLQGRFAWRQRHEENIRKSIELFEQAIAIDPTFARAHEALAAAWGVMPVWSDTSVDESAENAKPHAMRALELEPALPEARAVLAEISMHEHRWSYALAEYRKAISYEPRNPTLHQWLAEAFAYMGFLSKALEQMQIAYDLDPGSPVINQSMAWIASLNREDDLALRHVEISKGLGVGERAIFSAVDSLARLGDWQMVLDNLEAAVELPELARLCTQAQGNPVLIEQLIPLLEERLANTDTQFLGNQFSLCLALTGQTERAANLTRAAIQEQWQILRIFWRSNEQAAAMRQTKAFRQTLEDLDILDFYRDYGWPDLCRPVGDDDFECDL